MYIMLLRAKDKAVICKSKKKILPSRGISFEIFVNCKLLYTNNDNKYFF